MPLTGKQGRKVQLALVVHGYAPELNAGGHHFFPELEARQATTDALYLSRLDGELVTSHRQTLKPQAAHGKALSTVLCSHKPLNFKAATGLYYGAQYQLLPARQTQVRQLCTQAPVTSRLFGGCRQAAGKLVCGKIGDIQCAPAPPAQRLPGEKFKAGLGFPSGGSAQGQSLHLCRPEV